MLANPKICAEQDPIGYNEAGVYAEHVQKLSRVFCVCVSVLKIFKESFK